MEETLPIDNTITCPSCGATHTTEALFCNQCGYPLKGTDEQKINFENKRYVLKTKIQVAEKHINAARVTLYVIAGIAAFAGLLIAAVGTDDMIIEKFGVEKTPFVIAIAILGILYLAMGLWSRKRPFAALLIAFIVYTSLMIVEYAGDPEKIASAQIVFRGLIVFMLARGAKAGYEYEGHKKETFVN